MLDEPDTSVFFQLTELFDRRPADDTVTSTTPTTTTTATIMYGRAAFSVPFSSAEVHAVSKATSPQTSPAVPLMCEDGRPYVIDPATGRRLCACHLAPEGAHTHLHGAGSLSVGIKSLGSPLGSPLPVGLEAGGFYNNALLRGMMVRQERLAQCLTPAGHPMGFDPALAGHPYGLLYAGLDVNGLGMRKAATRETTGPLKAWLHEHKKNPYPTKAEKIMLAIITKMTLTQVSTWFANARRRLKKENRLYTGRDNDNEDDVTDKEDDADGTPKRLCDPGESDEDINVDVSDISDNEDDVSGRDANRAAQQHQHQHHNSSYTNAITSSTTTTTSHNINNPTSPPGMASAEQNISLSSSSAMSPFPLCTPPFHQSHFIPRPGPMPVFHPVHHGLPGLDPTRNGGAGGAAAALHTSDPLRTVVLGRDSGAATGSKLVTGGALSNQSNSSQSHSSRKDSSSSSSSNGTVHCPAAAAAAAAASVPPGGVVVRAPRPKIWSISQIIHSDTASSPSPSASTSSVASPSSVVSSSAKGNEGGGGDSGLQPHSKGDHRVPVQLLTPRGDMAGVVGQRPDFLHHRLASPFASLETPNGRLAARHHAAPSAFLVPGMHPNWAAPSLGLRLANPCEATMNVANGNENGEDCGSEVGETSPASCSSGGDSSLQTEALDLQTKKDEKDADSTAST